MYFICMIYRSWKNEKEKGFYLFSSRHNLVVTYNLQVEREKLNIIAGRKVQ